MTPQEMEALLKNTESMRDELSLEREYPNHAVEVAAMLAFNQLAKLAQELRLAITGREAG